MSRNNMKNDKNQDLIVKAINTLMPDLLKKALLISIGGIMLTEEVIRNLLGELKLSKEIVSAIVTQSNKAKDEIVRMVAKELRSLLTNINIDQEINKILQDIKIRIQMEIDLESKKSGRSILTIRPKVRKILKNKSKPAGKPNRTPILKTKA